MRAARVARVPKPPEDLPRSHTLPPGVHANASPLEACTGGEHAPRCRQALAVAKIWFEHWSLYALDPRLKPRPPGYWTGLLWACQGPSGVPLRHRRCVVTPGNISRVGGGFLRQPTAAVEPVATNSRSPVFLNSRPPNASITSRNRPKYSSRGSSARAGLTDVANLPCSALHRRARADPRTRPRHQRRTICAGHRCRCPQLGVRRRRPQSRPLGVAEGHGIGESGGLSVICPDGYLASRSDRW